MRLIFSFIVFAFLCCSCGREFQSVEEVQEFISESENGLTADQRNGDFSLKMTYQPNAILSGLEDSDHLVVFLMDIDYQGQNPMNYVEPGDLSDIINKLSHNTGPSFFARSGSGEKILPLKTFMPRAFDLDNKIRIMISYPVEIAEDENIQCVFESPFDQSQYTFEFQSKNIKKINTTIKRSQL